MKLIRTEDAVGHVLCHDMTQIIPGVVKDAVFRKGHIVQPEDIPVLLSIGKEELYVWEKKEGILHEDEAAQELCVLCRGEHMEASKPKEGKIELKALCDGLLKVNSKALFAVNSAGRMMIATRHGNFPVKAGDKLAGMRIIPLVIEQEAMEQAKKAARDCMDEGETILSLLPFAEKKAGIVTTGNEVYKGRIQDRFTPILEQKLAEYKTKVIAHEIWDDNQQRITDAILRMIDAGADLVLCTGGMSVDPDDRTPLAIRKTGAQVVSYGAPVLPGAMFLLAYYSCPDSGRIVPIMGLPGCVMYAARTIFDLVLPRVLADDPVTAEELAALGEGGLCLNCPQCTFPSCGFGK